MARITGILIHPASRSVARYTDDFGDDYTKIARPLECEWVEHVSLGNGDGIWLDEEGKLNGAADTRGEFWLRGNTGNLLRVQGNGLILGDDNMGGLKTPILTMEQVAASVLWEEPADNTDDGQPHVEFHTFDNPEAMADFLNNWRRGK